MAPVLLEVGPFTLYSYGVAIVVASLVAVGWGVGFAPLRRLLAADDVLAMALAGLVAGVLCGRLGLVALGGAGAGVPLAPSGGLIQVAALGGLGGAALYLRSRSLPVVASLDAGVAAIPLGMAVGRLGCLAAGCCWGSACDGPWAVTYTDPTARALTGVPLGVALHPTPAYLALGSLVAFVAVRAAAVRGARLAPLATFLVVDGLARLLVAPVRGDEGVLIAGLSYGAALGAVFVLAGSLLFAAGRHTEGRCNE